MLTLLVDDDNFVLHVLSHQLEHIGREGIITYTQADLALAYLADNPSTIDLIFCDLQMPGMDGIEFIRQLATVDYSGALVIMSGEDERILNTAEKLARAHHLNVIGHLIKPSSLGAVEKLVAKVSDLQIESNTAPGAYSSDDLSNAITQGQLLNYYQPKVDLSNGKIVGVETLVRWAHPKDGLIFPDMFIELAEESQLIDTLTRVVMRMALEHGHEWRQNGVDLGVAVNVSMDNLKSMDFPDYVQQTLNETDYPASHLTLEVTESRLMSDPLATLEVLTRLRLKRIGLSIDDFGTGHSSLSQLRDAPFDELKIDRGFVHGASDNRAQRAIFEGSLNMARQLGIKAVAEGIEDVSDWNYVLSTGCNFAQGYFIAKPMPAGDIAEWLSLWQEFYTRLNDNGDHQPRAIQ